MFLNRLRIRGRLITLIVLPLLVIIGLSADLAIRRAGAARDAENTLRSVDIASSVGAILAGLQTERLESIGYLIDQAPLGDVLTSGPWTSGVGSEAQYGSALPAAIRSALTTSPA